MQEINLNKKEFIKLYEQMVLIRYFEEEVQRNMEKGLFHGTTHLCIGQEATAVGVCSVLKQGDKITSTHRGHGHSIAMGADINKMMAELFGKVTGYCKGKGGSLHIADVEYGNLGSNGIVGGGIPIAVGAALTAQMKKTNEVIICFFGDGATNEGSFHESLNIAAIWQLPVVFICENNEYGMSSPIKKMTNINNLSRRADSYGFPGITIDGNDLLQVMTETQIAVDQARSGRGPTLIEAKTYRYSGHSKSDQQVYRSTEEVMRHKANDPIKRFENKLCQQKMIEHQRILEINQHTLEKVEAATDFALQSQEPGIDDLFTDVYK